MFKKQSLFLCLVIAAPFAPLAAGAVFDHNLSYGVSDNPAVRELQDFLKNEKLYSAEITGNFLGVTRGAVTAFQKREGIAPASGFFGPLTRARASVLQAAYAGAGGRTLIELQNNLLLQIEALQARLALLRAQFGAEQVAIQSGQATSSSAVTPSPTTASSTPVVLPAPTPISELRISGLLEQSFPLTAITPLKIGEIILANHTQSPVAFVQLELDIHDAMNATLNRNRTIKFLARNGSSTNDTLISATDFVINNDPPPTGGSFRRQLKLSLPVTLAAGEEKTIGLWIELLDYVMSGSLTVELYQPYVTSAIIPVGGFRFVLTR